MNKDYVNNIFFSIFDDEYIPYNRNDIKNKILELKKILVKSVMASTISEKVELIKNIYKDQLLEVGEDYIVLEENRVSNKVCLILDRGNMYSIISRIEKHLKNEPISYNIDIEKFLLNKLYRIYFEKILYKYNNIAFEPTEYQYIELLFGGDCV